MAAVSDGLKGLVTACLIFGAAPAFAQTAPTDRYDDVFRKYTKRFFGVGFDWRLFKAQAIVESNIDPAARSHAGARGIMQLIPATFREVRSKNPDLHQMNDIERNIAAGICHARELWLLWSNDSDEPHRPQFVLGSYNAGRAGPARAADGARARAPPDLAEHHDGGARGAAVALRRDAGLRAARDVPIYSWTRTAACADRRRPRTLRATLSRNPISGASAPPRGRPGRRARPGGTRQRPRRRRRRPPPPRRRRDRSS
jgi:soluble lytic murein transglycosylase-like protein